MERYRERASFGKMHEESHSKQDTRRWSSYGMISRGEAVMTRYE